MNKAKKNVVVVGFNNIERNSLSLPLIENNKVHYVDTIKDAIKYQGYMLIIDNSSNVDLVLLDKKYRKSFKKFEKIMIYNKNYKCSYNKWSRFEKINNDIYLDISYSLGEEWEQYKIRMERDKEVIKFNCDKEKQLDKLFEYIKQYKCLKTENIVKDLDIDYRSIQRYMNDLNSIYNVIGYDYSKNEWYFIW